ncbi:hypothetical protein ACFUAG_18020 [Streptomyces sp. NPDC057193]|uniref:hypothetical protein n=1 Tax=unclassified Streptomyces TaxID=2593676 RepID=UPI00093BCC5D|nr:hypothetical protein [Streptomyces sp. CB02261]OKJ57472.1 hypothetical protein AMK29_27480 [Streptomyces sp. CB02261]
MVRTRLKLAATLAVVVLALTGFHSGHGSSSGGGGGGKSKSGKSRSDDDSGGGCSNDEKGNGDYSGSGDSGGSGRSAADEYTYDPTPTSTPTADVHVSVVDCVKPAQKKRKGKRAVKADTTATVRITSDAWEEKTFRVVVRFEGAGHRIVDQAERTVTVERRGTKTFEVAMAHPETVGRVEECVAFDEGEVPGTTATATPATTPSPTPSTTS